MSTRVHFNTLTKAQRETILEDLVKHPFVLLAKHGEAIPARSVAEELFEMVRGGLMQLGLDKDGKLLQGDLGQVAVSAYDLDQIAPGQIPIIVHGDQA